MQEEEYTIPEMVDEVRAGKMQRRQFMKRLTLMGISAADVGAIVTAAASRQFDTKPVLREIYRMQLIICNAMTSILRISHKGM